jgi:hypothetical protein
VGVMCYMASYANVLSIDSSHVFAFFVLHKDIVMDNDENVFLRYVRMYIQHERQAEQYLKRTTCVIVGPI